MFNNPLSFIDPTGLTANNSNTIVIKDRNEIQIFWEWLMDNWDQEPDGGSSWGGAESFMDGIWNYLTTGSFGRQGHGALGYDSNGNPGLSFTWWGPITGQAYQDIQSTLANTAFTIPWALHQEFIRLDIINPLMYKNKETMSFRGHDFMLYHNEWHLLPPLREIPLQGYQDPFDTERKPAQMTMSREKALQYELDKKLIRHAGFWNIINWPTAFGGAADVTSYLLTKTFGFSPWVIVTSYVSGGISAWQQMENAMREHDRHVEFLRLQ